MTKSGDTSVSADGDMSTTSKKSDVGQHFLRAARAGNLQKVLSLINQQNADIHSCNANGLNALHLASKEGHTDIVDELLHRNADPNIATKKGNTALHIASLAGQFEVVKLLLDAGARVNIQAQNGFTPLYMASQENHLEVVRLLLSKGANPGLTTDDGFTPLAVALQQGHDRIVALLLENDSHGKICLPALHIAAKKDDTKAANLLLNSDVNVDHQSSSGFTPLHIAAHYGNINMTELLISRGANVNFQAKNNITPLHVASKWGNQGVVECLINAGAELDCRTRDGLTPLHCASRSGHDTVIQLLLSAGANFTAKTRSGLNPLHMAAQGDHVDAARLLLQRGAQPDDPTIDYLTSLHVAAHYGNVRVAKLLLERECDVNARALNGFTPLHVACQKNRIKIVELLLKQGCLIEATTESGLTPLHVASFMGHLNIVILLLQHGANANASTIRCETSLHLAARTAQTEVARLLLRNGAQVDVRARGGQTPLHIASRIGNQELVSLLLEHAATVDASTKDTYTPLHLAAKGNHRDVCELLLKAGAQLEITTKSGFTPLHLATKHSHIETTKLLLSHGANVNAIGRNGLTSLHLATHYGSLPMVQLLLDYNASPIIQAKNGFIPLHIAAEKCYVEIAKLLLQSMKQCSEECNIQSRNGFTALHLACQDGSPIMTKLLIDSGAQVNALAKNGLTAMHLAAQEDSVKAAELLYEAGSQLDAKTKAGYTPLHTACHFGQVNMIRFLLGKGADVNAVTSMKSNALHLAAQQGHSTIIYVLLESGANPNMRNKYNWTPAHVARHQHYLNIFELLCQLTTCVESWEQEDTNELPFDLNNSLETNNITHEAKSAITNNKGLKDKVVLSGSNITRLELEHPDLMRENPITDTEEECVEPDYTIMPASPLFSRTQSHQSIDRHNQADHIKLSIEQLAYNSTSHGKNIVDKLSTVSGEDSIHEGRATEHTRGVVWRNGIRPESGLYETRIGRDYAELGRVGSSGLTGFSGMIEWDFAPDNVPISRKPIASGFLVSFLVDARGGSMRGSRHPGLRILVPPSAASAPIRITCRMLRPERATRPPQLNDCEGLACRIIELGPHPCRFNTSVLLEIPHFASLRGRQRELVVLRSDNGEIWREHSLEATDQAVQSALGQNFDGLETMDELREKRIIRILTNDFPQYLAIVSRLRQESSLIGSDGGVLSSSVVPQVQAVFPEGALQKRIRVGLQAQSIPTELVTRILGNRVSVSPIVTLEPRRRKFHKPITLTIPLPKTANMSLISNVKTQNLPSLRLLCSITGGVSPAQWEDITGSTPLSKVKDCVSFTTTVSARFWLIDCQAIHETAELASRLYIEATLVPYMGKFVVFSKRLDSDEALVRCFCVTDDKVDKTLECQEGFEVCAASPEVEVIEGRPLWLEANGNLLPVAKSDEQLCLNFNAFHENRLAFPVRMKDIQQEPVGNLAFMRDPRNLITHDLQDKEMGIHSSTILSSQRPITTLELRLGSDNKQFPIENPNILADTFGSLNCVFPNQLTSSKQETIDKDDKLMGIKSEWISKYAADVIARSQLDLIQVANEISSDWPKLVGILLPESNLTHTSNVNDLINWINQSEIKWHANHQFNDEFKFGINVSELRTTQDQALAVLLAWREQYGNDATGNQLDRALRQIGREDVIKSCMRDICYVVDAEEHVKATKQIDQLEDINQIRSESPELNTISLVGTETLLSGMDDMSKERKPQQQPQQEENDESQLDLNPNIIISPMPNESEMMSEIENRIEPKEILTENENLPQDSSQLDDEVYEEEEEGEGEQDDLEQHEESQEQTQEQNYWSHHLEPVISTSQKDGDPLLVHKANEINLMEETDLIRDSESMTTSSELLVTGLIDTQQEMQNIDLPFDKTTTKSEIELEEIGQIELENQIDKQIDHQTELSTEQLETNVLENNNNNIQSNDIIQPCSTPIEHRWDQEEDLTESTNLIPQINTNNEEEENVDFRPDQSFEYNTTIQTDQPRTELSTNLENIINIQTHIVDAHHGDQSVLVEQNQPLEVFDEGPHPHSVMVNENVEQSLASDAHHGLGPPQ